MPIRKGTKQPKNITRKRRLTVVQRTLSIAEKLEAMYSDLASRMDRVEHLIHHLRGQTVRIDQAPLRLELTPEVKAMLRELSQPRQVRQARAKRR
jgi:hypothetical protein